MDLPGPQQPHPQTQEQDHSCWRLFTSCFRYPSKPKLPNEGLIHFHDPPNHDITIVAIHGLGGHRERTWAHENQNLWLKDNLPLTDEFRNARICSFGYDANPIGSQSVATIRQIASNLNQTLIDMRDTKPLVFICHSLGGIIAKLAIIQAKGKETEESKNLYRRFRGILFFGTPHQGSREADLGAIAANTLKVVPFLPVNKKLIKSLKRDKKGLSEITEDFVNALKGGHLFVVCFYETKMMYNRIIVVQNSAVLTLPADQQTQIPSSANHSELIKFCDDKDSRYEQALAQLRYVRERALALTPLGFRKVNSKQVDELLLALHETSGDYERSLDGQSTRRYGNTSEWILKEQHFKDWEGQEHRGQESEDRRMALWLKGDVGVGKSITLATLVSRLQKDTKKLTLYHFCSGGRIKPTQVFASLLHQLLLKEPDLCPYVYWKYFHGQAFLSTSAEKLGSALKSTLSFTKINEVFIILDALDECDDPDNILVETLSGITLASGSCLKVLISSRPDGYMAGVNLASERIKLKIIELRPRFVEKDINTYITEQLDSVLSPSLRGADISRAGNVIKERAGNNWLLTYLLVNDIKEKKGLWTQNKLQEIISKLKTFHGGLYERYDKILDKIPQDARSDAMKLFKWLIIARRPLSLKEASIAIGLKDTHTSLDMLQCDIDRDMGPDKLRKLCGPLIHVDESIGRVTLLHYSVQEYLTNTASTRLDNWWRITLQDASLQIARDCITFLSFSEFSSSVSHPKDHYGPYTYDIPPAPHPDNLYENDHCSLRNLPFLKYAATEWASHLKSCEEDFLNDPDGRQFLEAFLIDKEKNVEFCFRLYQYFGNTGPFQETVSALQVVCYFGLEALVSLVVQTATPGSQGSAVVKQGYSQLEMCALGGHVGIAEQLLKLPQHIQDSRDGKAALTIAVDFGHTALVKCLLQRFPSFDSLSSQLESASVGGHTDIAKLLLEAGADINQGEKYSGPLEAAAYHGHLNMVELLIEWKADIDRFDNSSAHGDGSALHSAAAASQVEIVEKLLKSGANINLICGVYGTALQAAAYAGCMEVVQMLFKDAKDYPCGQYGSALQAAKFVGHTDIVRLLEGTPVDPIPPNGLSVVRTATLDTPARRTLYVFATEISRGRINGVERGIERTIQGIITAIERKNLRTLDFLLPIGVKAFQVVVEIGNENYLERLTKAGMMLLKKTIELKSSEETERLSRAWAKALLWAVEEGNRPNIARRMLELCVGDFQTRVDEGADEEAEQLVHTGIEILLATAEIENPKLLSIFLDVFVAALEQLMDGRFEKRTLEIIDGYADEFRTVLPQLNYKKDGTRARALAIAGALALRNAAENKKVKVTQYFARLYKEIIQWIFNKGHAEHILSKLGSQDNSQTSSGTEIHLGEEVLLVGKCLLQVETTDNNWSKIFRGVVTSATIQALTVAGEKGKFDVIEAHAESWVKGIVCSRPARSTREDIRSIFEVARDEGGPSDVVRKSLERIIMMVDGITEVSA